MTLAEVRERIRLIDEDLVALIAKRTEMAKYVIEAKKQEGISVNVENQNEVVLSRVADMATELGIDGGSVRRVYEILIQMSIERQHELCGEGNLP